uniref:Uncharacterized protein n=1 Tax=Meloidogyne enterolobii TaxID=390850 RepID=A0A6V7UCM9_MELEN|nr:unnamed protein product [Meloidogyne enterolobii]
MQMAERLNHNLPQCRDIWQIGGYSRLACICFYSSCYWVAYEVESLRLIDDDSLLDNF